MGQVENVSVETDPAFDRALKAAVQRGGSDPDAVLNALVEELEITAPLRFSISGLGSGSAGQQGLDVVFQSGTNPNAAANNAATAWLPILRGLEGNGGAYSARASLVEVNGGCIVAIEVTVEQPAEEDEPAPVTLTGISVSGCKTEYFVGQSFDPADMVITATYSDQTTKTIKNITQNGDQGVTWSPDANFNSTGEQKVTLSYGGKSAEVTVKVKAPTVQSIQITQKPSQTAYDVGATFNPIGMVITATYSDNVKTETINSNYENKGVTWTPETIEANTNQVTIQYGGREAKVDITVNPPTLTGITVNWSTKETYYTDGSIKKSDVVESVIADYSYGVDPTLTLDDYQLTIKPKGGTGTATVITADKLYTFTTAGEYTLTVTYKDQTQTTTITVADKGYTDDGQGNYTVTSAEGLKAVADIANNGNLGINITLTENINLTDMDWTPIGIDYNHQYTGTFNGGGHTITGLTVTGSNEYAGLFGRIGSGGKVMNVKLEGVQIESDNEMSAVGGVVGYSYGNIENCSVSGSVSSNSTAGGVVGAQLGGSITGCNTSATVKGVTYAGGIAGYTNGGASLTGCYATGSISVENNTTNAAWAGGVVGSNGSSTLTACYATGSVTSSGSGTIYAGGVTGTNDFGTLTACYHANGTISCPGGTTGGVAGRNYKGLMSYGGIITACFWGSNGQTQGIGEDQVGTGGTTMVDGETTWQKAVDAMNIALGSAGCAYKYQNGNTPTLMK